MDHIIEHAEQSKARSGRGERLAYLAYWERDNLSRYLHFLLMQCNGQS